MKACTHFEPLHVQRAVPNYIHDVIPLDNAIYCFVKTFMRFEDVQFASHLVLTIIPVL